MDEKTCPFCAETIKAAAIKCRYCGEFFEAAESAVEETESEPEFPEEFCESLSPEEEAEMLEARGRLHIATTLTKPPGLDGPKKNRPSFPQPIPETPGKTDWSTPMKPGADSTKFIVGLFSAVVFGIVLWTVFLLNNPSMVAEDPPPKVTDVRVVRSSGDNTVFEAKMSDGSKATFHVNQEGEIR